MSGTPTFNLPLPSDGSTPWGDAYRSTMMTVDARLFAVRGSFYAEDETAPTVIATAGVAVKANVATTPGPPCASCTYPVTNQLLYVGPLTRVITVWSSVFLTSSNNQTVGVEVRKNGQPVPGLSTLIRTGTVGSGGGSIVGSVEVETNDFLELWLTNRTSDANVTVVDVTLATRG